MEQVRKYGDAPYKVVVIHGGPGAGGEMAPVARVLSTERGVLEPIQTAESVEGQIEELKSVIQEHGFPPLVLIGYSWGAWLGLFVASRYPALVAKLIMVSSGAFDEDSSNKGHQLRLSRLEPCEKDEFSSLIAALDDPSIEDKDSLLGRLGALASKADGFDLLPHADEGTLSARIFRSVWKEAAMLRKKGLLLESAKHIECPVTAIHGDFDSHPAEGVRKPLSETLAAFRFILLQECGHTPWLERRAKDKFFNVIKEELKFNSLRVFP